MLTPYFLTTLARPADALQYADDRHDRLGGGIDADDRVAVAVAEPLADRGQHAGDVVARMVGLQPAGDAPGQPERAVAADHHADFA